MRIANLEPLRIAVGYGVGAVLVLCDDAFQVMLARQSEERLATALDMVAAQQPFGERAQRAPQTELALIERGVAQVFAVNP